MNSTKDQVARLEVLAEDTRVFFAARLDFPIMQKYHGLLARPDTSPNAKVAALSLFSLGTEILLREMQMRGLVEYNAEQVRCTRPRGWSAA